MNKIQTNDSGEEGWRRAPELPPAIFKVLNKQDRAINPICIVATVDQDGSPRTAPFGSLRAVTPKLLRLACNHHHHTYGNICRSGMASVAVLAPPNIAVSILGRARVVHQHMKTAENLAILEIDIIQIKNDMIRKGGITSGIGFNPPEEQREFYLGLIAEIEDLEGESG
jgi:hypothetical protein